MDEERLTAGVDDERPSRFLHGPSTVLVVGDGEFAGSVAAAVDGHAFPSPVTSEEVRAADAVEGDVPVTAVTVADADAARETLAADETVGCVVLDAEGVPDAVAAVEAVTAADPDLPVVVSAAAGDERLASAVTRAGAFAYLPRDGRADAAPGAHGNGSGPDGRETLLGVLEDALEAADRRWRARTESEMLDTMLADLDVPLYVKDRAARHLKMADTTGGPAPEDAIGKTDWELYSWDDTSKVEALGDDRLVIDEDEAIRDREEQHGPPEAGRWLRTTKVPWRRDDGIAGLVGVSVDVTDEHRTIRDLRAQNRRLDDFASFVAHDLRNPLHAATAFLNHSRDGEDDHLDRVAEALDRMERLIEDLSELATDEGTAPAPSGGVAFDPLLQVVWDELATTEATLEVDLPPETVLYTNRLQLKPLFENLFKNAIEHAGPDVTVTVGARETGFYVADDGPGIPPVDRETVFEEGYTTAESGSGTGLAIVSEIADTHGWDLALTESDAGGVRFEFGNVLLVTDPDQPATGTRSWPLTAGRDVGDVLNAGESTHDPDAGTWRLRAAGDNLWGDTNEFHFRWAECEGPVRVEARLDAFEAPADHSKAGMMVRDDATEQATFGFVGRMGDGRTELLWRTEAGDPTRSQHLTASDQGFEWFRIDRVGDRLTASVSADGEEWHAVDQRRVDLDGALCVGLAACSTFIGSYCDATFSNVSVTELDAD